MFVLLSVVIGILIGVGRKGSIGGLMASRPKFWFLGLVGAVLQLFLHLTCYFKGLASYGSMMTILCFLSYILILVMIIFNLDDLWMVVLALGITVCFVVTFLNGGMMPVSESVLNALNGNTLAQSISAGSSVIYTPIVADATTLSFLGVVVPVPFLGTVTALYGAVPGFSVGGFLIFVGLVGCIQKRMAIKVQKDIPVTVDNDHDDFDADDFLMPPRKDHHKRFLRDFDSDDDDGIFAEGALEDSPYFTNGGFDVLTANEVPTARTAEELENPEILSVDVSGTQQTSEETIQKEANKEEDVDAIFDEVQEESIKGGSGQTDEVFKTKVFRSIADLEIDDVELIEEMPLEVSPTLPPVEMTTSSEAQTVSISQGEVDNSENQKGFEPLESSFFTRSRSEAQSEDLKFDEEWDPEEAFFVKTPVGEHVDFGEEPMIFTESDMMSDEKPEVMDDVLEEDDHSWVSLGWIVPGNSPKKQVRGAVGQEIGDGITGSQNWVPMSPARRETDRSDDDKAASPVWECTDMGRNTGRSETDMMNIWKQVSNQTRQQKRQQHFNTDSNPFRDERRRDVTPIGELVIDQKRSLSEQQAYLAHQWEDGLKRSDLASVSGGDLIARAVQTQVMRVVEPESEADRRKQRMGFEKVAIEVNGREVVFWQRKK